MSAVRSLHWQSSSICLLPEPVMERRRSCLCSKFATQPRWVHVTTETPHWRVNFLFGSVIAQLVIVHLIEVMIWALPLYGLNLIPELSAAAFFAAETYTTLGEGAVRLPLSWRQLGPIIAVSGLFTFGWTSSVLVYVVTQFGTLDTHHAERKKIAESDAA